MKTDTYTNEAIRDMLAIAKGKRDLSIISQAKSSVALTSLRVTAQEHGLQAYMTTLDCEDGLAHAHLLIGRGREPMKALELINARVRRDITRETLQTGLGIMLGYTAESIEGFTASSLAASCPCHCCGGAV